MKPVYGRQEGAQLGYSPQKPGRPSHCYHTLCIAKLRLTLAVVVHPGDETSGAHSRPMLAEYLRFASSVRKPLLVRGDVSFGSEEIALEIVNARVRTAVTHAYPDRTIHLTLIDCEPAPGAEPTALEHEALGWYTPDEMGALDFCPADAELLPVLFPM